MSSSGCDGSDLQPNALVPELSVRDCRCSLAFYCAVLGFEVAYERPEEGFAYLRLGDAQLMIDQIGIGRDFGAPGGAPLTAPLGRGMNLQIEVAAIDSLVARLSAAGIALHLPIEERWYRQEDKVTGLRQFIVADPDGYLLRSHESLGQRPSVERSDP